MEKKDVSITAAELDKVIRGENPVTAAFGLATRLVVKSRISTKIDEEATTNAFLGALIGSFAWTAQLCEQKGDEAVREAGWSSYRKSGKGEKTESSVGADFGVVLKMSDDDVRIAIFQAKRGHENSAGKNFVDVRRPIKEVELAGKDGNKTSEQRIQMERLAITGGYAVEADRRNGKSEPVGQTATDAMLASMDWIHYLGYMDGNFRAIGLHQLGAAYDKEVTNRDSLSYNDVELTSTNSLPFDELIKKGLGKKVGHGDGWISLHQEDAQELVGMFIPFVDFHVADSGRGGSFDPNPNAEPRILNRRDQKENPTLTSRSVGVSLAERRALQDVVTPTLTTRASKKFTRGS